MYNWPNVRITEGDRLRTALRLVRSDVNAESAGNPTPACQFPWLIGSQSQELGSITRQHYDRNPLIGDFFFCVALKVYPGAVAAFSATAPSRALTLCSGLNNLMTISSRAIQAGLTEFTCHRFAATHNRSQPLRHSLSCSLQLDNQWHPNTFQLGVVPSHRRDIVPRDHRRSHWLTISCHQYLLCQFHSISNSRC
jgi:hypothetical protein